MGILETLKIVEKREDVFDSTSGELLKTTAASVTLIIPDMPVDMTPVVVDNLITESYEQSNLSDREKSIYKVEELRATLPKDMPTVAKSQTVCGIMKSFGLNVDTVLNDAEERFNALGGSLHNITINNDSKVANAENDIKNMEDAIEELKQIIFDTKAETEKCTNIITAEQDRIKELVTFVEGGLK